MDSINKQQPEHNREDLQAGDAVSRIRDMIKSNSSCFFCTSISTSGSMGVRPMSVQKTDDSGALWFLSADDSHKNDEVKVDPNVKLYFQGSEHSDFLYLEGKATISKDKKKIDELWEPIIKTWFTGGKDDPRITVIKVEPTSGYYWDNKHGNVVAGVKMLFGAMVGQTFDDSIEGRIKT